jgi:hypothetical protein
MAHMADLVYGTDRHLRDGERVLAGFRDEGPYGCLLVQQREYEILHDGRTGWHFHLIDRETRERVCEYEPRRLIPGGRIRGPRACMTVRGVALHRRRWTLASESGWRLEAKVSGWPNVSRGEDVFDWRAACRALRRPVRPSREAKSRPPDATGNADGPPAAPSYHTVELRGPDVAMSREVSMQLAFGCWLLSELEETYELSGFGS